MSKIFFEDLKLPHPNYYLNVGSGSHAKQTAKIMIEFEKVLLNEKPELIIVGGDVNSTIACSLVASKINIKIAHVESGLRSFDRKMPEEINRKLTDSISDFLFVSEQSGVDNLKKEGIQADKIYFTGNVMIDSLIKYLPLAEKSAILNQFHLKSNDYILTTIHRPSNVDFPEKLGKLLIMLNHLGEKKKIIFPVHPRTKKNMINFGLNKNHSKNLNIINPVGYIDFITLMKNAALVITDSGGIQEECTYLGKQCITVRTTTERPITIEIGTNHLVGDDFNKAEATATSILNEEKKEGKIPELWDGHAGERIVEILANSF